MNSWNATDAMLNGKGSCWMGPNRLVAERDDDMKIQGCLRKCHQTLNSEICKCTFRSYRDAINVCVFCRDQKQPDAQRLQADLVVVSSQSFVLNPLMLWYVTVLCNM